MWKYIFLRGYEFFLTLRSVTVQAETRTLRAEWSPEMAQDIAMYHNIDAEQELTELLSRELSDAINREILLALLPQINKFKFLRGNE